MVSAFSSFTAACVAVAVFTCNGVDAHGTLSKPQLKFTGSGYGGNFQADIDMKGVLKPLAGDTFFNYPSWKANAEAFGRAFKAQTEYKTLKDFMLKNQRMQNGRDNMPKTPECGFTDPTSGPGQEPPAQLEWYGGKMNHDGPCEVWCDDEVVLPFTANCAETFPQGKFTYDREKCVGKSRLTMYWMSTLLQWQVYIQCAKLNGKGGSGTAVTTTKPNPAPAPQPNPAPAPVPKATTATPSSGNTGNDASSSTTKPGCKRKLREIQEE